MLERICIASVVSLQVIDFPTIVQSAFSQVPRDRKRLALIVVGRHFSLGTDATATLKGMELRGLVDRIFGAGFKVDAEKLLTVSSAGEDIVTLIGAIATVEQALLVNLVLARMTVAGRLSDEDERHLASWWTAFKEACSSVAGSSNAMWNLLVDCQLMRFDVYSEDEEAKSVLIQRMRGALDILASDPVTNLSSLGLLGHLLVLKHLHQTPNNHASTSMAQAYLGIPTILHTLSVHLRVIPLAIARIRALLNSDGVRAKFMTNRAFIDSIEGVLNGTTPFEPWLVEVMDRLGVAALLDRACELYPGAGEDFTTGDV